MAQWPAGQRACQADTGGYALGKRDKSMLTHTSARKGFPSPNQRDSG